MRRLLAVITFATVAWLFVPASDASAAPPCSPQNEFLTLDGVSARYNNQPAQMTASGRFVTDAGVEFYVSHTGDVLAIPFEGAACGAGAQTVTLRLTDPWTGEPLTTSLGAMP